MGLKYFTKYQDPSGNTKEIRFFNDDFSGAAIEWKNDKAAVRYSRGTSDAFFPEQPIIASQAQIGLILTERYDLTDFVYNRKTFYVEIHDTILNRVTWSGWLEPWGAQHDYAKPPYVVTLTASCGLSHLSKKKYANSDTSFKKTGLQIIQDCLKVIGRDDLPIRLSTHMYENGFTGDDRLGLESFEENTFRYYDENGEALYCDVIVNNILEHFTAEITQWDNKWVIVSVVDRSTSFATSYLDIGGATNPLAWPSVFTINGDYAKSLSGGQVRVLAPKNKYRVEIDFGQQKPFFENGNMLLWNENGLIGWDFTHMTKGNPGWEQFGLGGETGRSVLKINGKSPQPYKKKKKKKFWQVVVPILTGMVGANLKKDYEYVEPSQWIESPGGSISKADKSVNISFDYETEAFSSDILISIRIPSTDSKGNVKNFWVDPSSQPALAGADKSKASASPDFCLIRIPPVDLGALTDKGTIDVSGNPPYPAANYTPGSKQVNWTWTATGVPAGEYRRIGGVNGVLVENGDLIIARVPNLGGSQEAVGGSWEVISIRNNTKKAHFELGVSLNTTFITKPGEPFPADKVYVRFYKMADDKGLPGDWYKVYNLDGKLEGFVASDESAKYATTLERGDVTDEEAEIIKLISGDYTPWYVGTWTRPGTETPTSSWRRRPQHNESMSVYRAMMKDRLSMTTRPLAVVEGKIKLLPGDRYLHYLHKLYFEDQNKYFRIVRFAYDDGRQEAELTAVEIKYEEIPDSELRQDAYIPGSRQLNTVSGQGDGIYPSKQDSTNGRLNAEDMPLTEEERDEQLSAGGRLAAIFEDVPPLVFTIGEMETKGVDLSKYLSATLLYNLETDDEQEAVFDMTDLVFKVKSKPTWVTKAVEDDLFVAVTGKPTALGTYQVVFEVSDGTDADAEEMVDDDGNVIPTVSFSMDVAVPIIVYPKTTIKYTLRDTSGSEPLGVGNIVNGAGFLKPDTWDVLVQVTGHHEGWFGKLSGMGINVQPAADPYSLTPSTDYATYIIGFNIDSEVGIYDLLFATFREEAEPDNLKKVKEDKIKFTLYDEAYLNKGQFELWGAESGVLIGPINPNGLSAFNVEEPWDVKMIIDGVEHDAGQSVLGSEAGDLDTLVIGPLDPAVTDASYFQFGEPRPEFDPSTYNVMLSLGLDSEEKYRRMATFTINKKKVQPTAGKIKLGSIPLNTTNFDLIAELELTGNAFASLPIPNWALMVDDESEDFDADEWELFQFKAGYLVPIDIAARTGNPQTHPYGEVLTQVESRAFGELSSIDIGDIHKIPSTFRAIYRRRLAGSVVKLYQADFSFGPLVEIPDETEVGGPGSGTGVMEIYPGSGMSQIIDDGIQTLNVNVDDQTIEIYDHTNLSRNWLRIKDKGVAFAKMQDIPTLSLIGKLTAGTGTPYAVSVLNGASAVAASDTTVGTTLWVKNQLTGTVSGLAGRLAKFATNNTLTYSILEESGIALIAQQGVFVSNNASNTNVRGFVVQEDGKNRFSFGKQGTPANFAFWRWDDLGTTLLGTPLSIERATGKITLETQLTILGSSLAPLVVSSTVLVTNFNADMLDGQHGPYYLDWNNFTNKKSIIAGAGLTGGGLLDADRGLNLGTPSTLSNTTINSSSGTTHTHAIQVSNLIAGTNVSLSASGTGVILGPNNITINVSSVPWNTGVSGKPTTIDGFGITDAVKLVDFNVALGGKENIFSKGDLIQGAGISLSGTLTGRLVNTGNVTVALAASGVAAGTYNSVTVDAYGRVTAGSNVSSGISGTAGYIAQFGSGGTTVVNSVIRDTGTEINIANTRDFGVEGPAAMRGYLHVHGYVSIGKSTQHGQVVIHHETSATPHPNAILDLRSTEKVVILPKLTITDMLAITPELGMMCFASNGTSVDGLYVVQQMDNGFLGWKRHVTTSMP